MFPLGSTPSKRRVESYRILYAHILHALRLPGHPLRVTEKATHGEQMGLYSWHSQMGTSITINIVPKCEVCPRDHGKVVESLRGVEIQPGLYMLGSKLGWNLAGRTSDSVETTEEQCLLVVTYGNEIERNTTVFTKTDAALPTKPTLGDFWRLESRGIHDTPRDPEEK